MIQNELSETNGGNLNLSYNLTKFYSHKYRALTLTITTPIIFMSTTFSSIFSNEARAEGSGSVRATRGSGRHRSLLDHVQSRAARRVAACREVTPFDFNIGRYQVSPSSDVVSRLRD